MDLSALQHLLGLWDLEVRTAGGGGHGPAEPGAAGGHSLHTALLRGIEDGPAVRDRLLQRMSEARDAGLGEVPGTGAARDTGEDLAPSIRRVREASQALRAVLES